MSNSPETQVSDQSFEAWERGSLINGALTDSEYAAWVEAAEVTARGWRARCRAAWDARSAEVERLKQLIADHDSDKGAQDCYTICPLTNMT